MKYSSNPRKTCLFIQFDWISTWTWWEKYQVRMRTEKEKNSFADRMRTAQFSFFPWHSVLLVKNGISSPSLPDKTTISKPSRSLFCMGIFFFMSPITMRTLIKMKYRFDNKNISNCNSESSIAKFQLGFIWLPSLSIKNFLFVALKRQSTYQSVYTLSIRIRLLFQLTMRAYTVCPL